VYGSEHETVNRMLSIRKHPNVCAGGGRQAGALPAANVGRFRPVRASSFQPGWSTGRDGVDGSSPTGRRDGTVPDPVAISSLPGMIDQLRRLWVA
jgi:hypothetical protein